MASGHQNPIDFPNAVNRVWEQLFGKRFVASLKDLGFNKQTLLLIPELLDICLADDAMNMIGV